MTGFGKVTAELPTKKVTIEIKALNSKQLDLSTRIPPIYKAKEMAIRSLLLQQLERGKVDFSIFIEDIHKSSSAQINQEMFLYYYQQILSLSTRLGVDAPRSWNELQGIFRLPDVISAEQTEADEQEWAVVEEAIRSAIAQLQEFRTQEGAMLYRLFQEKIRNITQLLAEIDPYEKERVEKIRARILDALIHGRDGVVQRLLAGYVAQHLAVGLHAQQVRLCQRRAEQHNAPGGAQRHHGGANGARGPRAAPGRPGCGVRLLQRLQQHQQPPGQPAQQQAQQPQQPAPGADHLIFNKKADRIQQLAGRVPVGPGTQAGGQAAAPPGAPLPPLPGTHGAAALPGVCQRAQRAGLRVKRFLHGQK